MRFLRTLDKGLKMMAEIVEHATAVDTTDAIVVKKVSISGHAQSNSAFSGIVSGKIAFELYDTFGFPVDLTKLIAKENNLQVDEVDFERELQKQKDRSRAAKSVDTEDWIVLKEGTNKFVGYNTLESKASILKYRKVKSKDKELYQIVLDKTPFYAESGGQAGDSGVLVLPSPSGEGSGVRLLITDTKKDNDLIIHFTETIPADISGEAIAKVDATRRKNIELHHSATHLVHAALRNCLRHPCYPKRFPGK